MLGYSKAEVVGQHVVSASPENSSSLCGRMLGSAPIVKEAATAIPYVTIVMSAGISADAEWTNADYQT